MNRDPKSRGPADQAAYERLTEPDHATRQEHYASLAVALIDDIAYKVSNFVPVGFRIAVLLLDADIEAIAYFGRPEDHPDYARLRAALANCTLDADVHTFSRNGR